MCMLIILSKLLSRNDVRFIGLKSFAVVSVAFTALGTKTTFVSCLAFGSSLSLSYGLEDFLQLVYGYGRRGLVVPCLANSSAMQLPTMSHIRLIVN